MHYHETSHKQDHNREPFTLTPEKERISSRNILELDSYVDIVKDMQNARRELHLNDRQVAILCMAREGMANKEIAAHLKISLPTVKRLMHTLLLKLQARDRTNAVIKAIRLSIITVEPECRNDII